METYAAAAAAFCLALRLAPVGAEEAKGARAAGERTPVEAVFHNGTIYTMDDERPVVEALAVGGGLIVAAGRSSDLLEGLPPGVMRIDLGGRPVIPGLTDAHAHFLGYAEKSAWLDLKGTRSLDEVLAHAAAGTAAGGGWILGRGWDQNDWAVPEYPRAASLDAVIRGRPVYLVRVCGHAAYVNSAALRLAGIARSTPDPTGGRIVRDAASEPTGILIDNAMDLVSRHIPLCGPAEKKRLLREAAQRCLAAGLVGVHEMGISAETVGLYREMYEAGGLPFRVTAYLDGSDPGLEGLLAAEAANASAGGDRFSVVGVKFYADGSLGARSAALLEDYSDDPGNRGILVQGAGELREGIRRCHKRGLQAAVHAIGDAAVRAALDAYERVMAEHPMPDRRHRIEHAQVIAASDVPRFADLGVVPSMQFTHCTSDMPWVGSRLGEERERGAYAWRSLVDEGNRIPGGSDFPVESIDPFLGIYAAVTRMDPGGNPAGGWHPEQRLTVREAVKAFTVDAAWAVHREDIAGSLAPGKLADFVVLSQDVFAVDPAVIPSIRVLATVLGGEVVYRSAEF